VDYHKGHHAVQIDNQYYKCNNYHYKKKMTTRWDMKVEWHNNSTFNLLLESSRNPTPFKWQIMPKQIEIDMEPTFDWWVPTVL